MKRVRSFFISALFLSAIPGCSAQDNVVNIDKLPYQIYPQLNDEKPALASPFTDQKGEEYVVAATKDNKYAIVQVTLSNEGRMCRQLEIDTADFPLLGRTGLHAEEHLEQVKTITGRTTHEITSLGRPGGLSQGGFMAEDEDIISVLKGDNRLVRLLELTHPQLAKPLFHVLNMMDADLSLDRWNMARHRWEHITHFFYHSQKVLVDAYDTKGGQLSIFDDSIQGGFHIKLWREFDEREAQYLGDHYGHLSAEELEELKSLLSFMNTGEMEPQYIMRYGFYEGHTFWRTDPIAISFIFGFKSLEELDEIFEGRLYEILTEHFVQN